MARIRTIKPEFWSSPSMRGANPWARLLYVAMWNWADDSGRGTANVRELAAFAFPDDQDPIAPTVAELPSLLAEVRGRWGVIFYEVCGRRYYAIPTWDTHQRNERRAQSRHPAPEDGSPYDPDPLDQGKPGNGHRSTDVPPRSHGTSVQTVGSSGTGTGEQGNRGTGEKGKHSVNEARSSNVKDDSPRKPRAPRAERDPDGFPDFWAAYPRKTAKRAAAKAFAAAIKRGVEPAELVSAASRYAATVRHTEPRFVAHPATWLNQGRHEDEPDPVHTPAPVKSKTSQAAEASYAAGQEWLADLRNGSPRQPTHIRALGA